MRQFIADSPTLCTNHAHITRFQLTEKEEVEAKNKIIINNVKCAATMRSCSDILIIAARMTGPSPEGVACIHLQQRTANKKSKKNINERKSLTRQINELRFFFNFFLVSLHYVAK